MGYTNYWHQHNDFTDEQWKSIKEEYDYIKEVCGNIIKDETITTDEIVFNGLGRFGFLCQEFMKIQFLKTFFDLWNLVGRTALLANQRSRSWLVF